MFHRCPLCLKLVQPADRFIRYCPRHPEHTVELTGEALSRCDLQDALCVEPDCTSAGVVNTTGLLLKHVDCPLGRAPFVPAPVVRLFRGTDLRHWELLVLEDIQRKLKTGVIACPSLHLLGGPEMLFPYALLIRQDPFGVSPPSHVLVGVLGAKNVGKTFLTMHLADLQGYGRSRLPKPDDFLYCVPGEGTDPHEEFLNTLLLRQLLDTNQDFRTHLLSTRERLLNLKAGMFPRELLTSWLKLGGTRSTSSPSGSAPQGRLHAFFSEVWQAVLRVSTPPPSSAGLATACCSLLMYDIAGESVTAGHSRIVDDHLNAMDLIAVIVSAEDLITTGPGGGSLEIAANMLARLHDWKRLRPSSMPKGRVGVVVTKVDLGPQSLKDLSAKDCTSEERRAVLVCELDRLASPAAAALADLVGRGNGLVDRVFFIKPEFKEPYIPVVFGLSDLVRWCFDKRAC